MRYYVHHEAAPEFTLAVESKPSDSRTVAALRADFAAAYSSFTGSTVYASELQLSVAEDAPPLPLTACVAQVATEDGDFFAVRGAPMPDPTPAASSAVASASTADSAAALVSKVKAHMKKGEKAWEEKSYRKARAIYSELVQFGGALLTGGKTNAQIGLAMQRLGEIEVINNRAAKGLPFLERAELAAPSSIEVHEKLADCYMALNDPQEAVNEMQAAISAWAQDPNCADSTATPPTLLHTLGTSGES